MTDEIRYWIWLAEAIGQGNRNSGELWNTYGSAKSVYEDPSLEKLEEADVLSKETLGRLRTKLRVHSLDLADYILERCDRIGCTVLTPDMPEFPSPLRTLPDLPLVLYVLGNLPDCSANLLTAVVGTRKMTEYGRTVAYAIGSGLANGGSVVVSGMALGADSMALLGALEAGGKTVAVLGSGVDVVYPKEHRRVYERILAKGAVVSEYAPGSEPAAQHFPVRNRIMSGLSSATVVIEASMDSGALITARRAMEQGRKLFAVPGRIGDPGAEGTNYLLRDGAIPAVDAIDILEEFEFEFRAAVNVQAAKEALRGMNAEAVSRDAMERCGIGTRGESRNYYGVGSYGGRVREEVRIPKPSVQSETTVKAAVPTSPEPKKKGISAVFGKKNEKSPRQIEKQTVNSDEKVIPAQKIELETLDENEIKVYNKMKPNVPILPDELIGDGQTVEEVLSALTMLEMAGAVETGHGGFYIRVSPDDIMQSPND